MPGMNSRLNWKCRTGDPVSRSRRVHSCNSYYCTAKLSFTECGGDAVNVVWKEAREDKGPGGEVKLGHVLGQDGIE